VDAAKGGGAVFTIALPVKSPQPGAASDASSAQRSAVRRKVLVVDDEPDIRESLAEILSAASHRVVTASSGREALERLTIERYDVILTDIRMPDMDGRALYQQIQAKWPSELARVVFVTGDTLASELREFVCRSGRLVIEKPFLPSEVRRVVADVASNVCAR